MKNFIIGFLICFILLGGNIVFVFVEGVKRSTTTILPELIMFLLLLIVAFLLIFKTFENKMNFFKELYVEPDSNKLLAPVLFRTLPVAIFSMANAIIVPYMFYCIRTHQEIFSMQTAQNVIIMIENFLK